MTDDRPIPRRIEHSILFLILLLFGLLSIVGITWGLPSRRIDPYLFGDGQPWSGETIYRLAGAAEKLSPGRGADVDADPLASRGDEPALLTGTAEDVAKIYLRYRLYTYQPDEMITMMALSGMSPRRLRLDPKLYQYGGLFIYSVGALIGAAGVTGLIDLRGDVVFYLDNPDEFGKFYVVARAYAATWGLIGVVLVFAITRRLAGSLAGLLGALLFTLMPVVVCMAHEGKPHLPGAVLMLAAVLFAMRHLAIGAGEDQRAATNATDPNGKRFDRSNRDWWLMCVCCGAALGMVLSSLPIFVLIPLVAWLAQRCQADGNTAGAWAAWAGRTIGGGAVGAAVYLVTNPYLVINAVVNRDVLASNFGNSLGMYQIARLGEGLVRVLELTTEGATLPIVVFGSAALAAAVLRRRGAAGKGMILAPRVAIVPLAVVAAVFFFQFVLIGAGKPGEYGRFGVFTNTALAIGTACLLSRRRTRVRAIESWLPIVIVVAWTGVCGWAYLRNFSIDASGDGSRIVLAQQLQGLAAPAAPSDARRLAVSAEPAPYSCPPLRFDEWTVVVHDLPRDRDRCGYGLEASDTLNAESGEVAASGVPQGWGSAVRDFFAKDRITPISWANKPFRRFQRGRPTTSLTRPHP